MRSMNIIFYLVGPYDDFHRGPMIRTLASRLEGRGEVLCVEPWGRGLKGGSEVRQVGSNIHVYRPNVLPHESLLHRLGARDAHWRSLSRRLRSVVDSVMGPSVLRIAWLYKPEQLWLAGMAEETDLVYECYDEYQYDMLGQPLPEIRRLEQKLLKIADQVFVTSERLRPPRAAYNQTTMVVPNGVDFERFASPTGTVPKDILSLPRPRIGHVGRLMRCLDLGLLREAAAARPEWTFIHIGPIAPEVDASPLQSLPNFHFLSARPQSEIPACLKGLDAALMFFRKNRFTDGVDPLKLYEYIAAGLPVVSTPFGTIRETDGTLWVASDPSGYVEAIEQALTRVGPQRRIAGLLMAKSRDWSVLAGRMMEALERLYEAQSVSGRAA